MATLYDLAMQYLNQSLPETFKYDRTNQPATPAPNPTDPTDPNAPKKVIQLGSPNGGGGFNPYNPDPNSISNKNYSPYAYRQAAAKSGVGIPSGILSDSEFLYGPQLTGIPGAIANYAKNGLVGKGLDYLGSKLPVNSRAIYENELLGQGLRLDDIGRIVSDGGNINTAENIMAGYNANKVTAETFKKRRDMINSKMKDPAQKAAKLAALDAAEEKMLGTAKTRADMVFDDKSLAKDPSYVPFDTQLDINNKINQEKELDELLDYTNPNIYNTDSIYTATAPTYTTDPYVSGQDNKDIGTAPPGTFDGTPDYYGGVGDSVIDAGGTAPGGGYTSDYYGGVGDSVIDAGGTAPGGGYTSDYYGGGGGYDFSDFDDGDNSRADPGGTGNFSDAVTGNDTSPGATGGEGGNSGGGGGGTHCCTAANERGDMTLLEVKKLRVWHRKQSKIWQKGYDVWGRVMADNLVSKYKWSSDRVRDFYNHKIYGKRTIGSTFADFCIYPMSMVIGFILTVMPPILGYQKNKNA